MKTLLLFFTLALGTFSAFSQKSIVINYLSGSVPGISTGNVNQNSKFTINKDVSEFKTFKIVSSNGIPANHKLVVSVTGVAFQSGDGDFTGTAKDFTFAGSILDKTVDIKEVDAAGNPTQLFTITFEKDKSERPQNESTTRVMPLVSLLGEIESKYKKTRIGFVESSVALKEEINEEPAVHIFLDQNGNNLLGTIPQGVANRQYIVHLIYPGFSDAEGDVTYSVRQKTGSVNTSLSFLNSGILNSVTNNLQGAETGRAFDKWEEKTFLLGMATDDLTFEVIATVKGPNNAVVSGVLQTYTIKMSPVHHGSFDIGLLNSELGNPTYTRVTAPSGGPNQVVKETEGGNRGVVTVMATFYTSPILLIKKFLGKADVPTYKLTGRNFLDDHKFFERIYPAIGVRLGSRTFENLFFGLNWELARGFSVFGGGHHAKVSTFEMPGFTPGATIVTEDQFNFYSNTKWKTGWAYGVKLDVSVIGNLFRP